jgi:hypothetical protein
MIIWRVDMKILKIAVALGLLWFVFYGSIPSIDINPIPDEIDEVEAIIDIDRPSDEIIEQVRPVANLVTDIEDKAKMSLFNYEFANRVTKYETDVQQLNDLYTDAGGRFFENTLKGKYENLPTELQKLFSSITTDDNHVLNQEEKQKIKELFTGLSWALIER